MVRLVGLRCCPPWPSIARGSVRSVPSRTIVSGARIRFRDVRSTLVTFAPTFPTRPGPAARTPVWILTARLLHLPPFRSFPFGIGTCLPLDQPGRPSFLSWDCPKIAPPSCCSPGSPLPEAACRLPGGLPPSGWECHFPSAFRPRGLAPPRRFPPPCRDARVAAHCRPWGSSRFRRWRASRRPLRVGRTRAPALPRDAFLPFEAFPPNTAADERLERCSSAGGSSP
jgi:hypothetical protein